MNTSTAFRLTNTARRRAGSTLPPLLAMLLLAGCAAKVPDEDPAERTETTQQALTPPSLSDWWGWGEVQGAGRTNSALSATSFDQRIYLFARGTDNKLWVNSAYNGRGFEGWLAVPNSPIMSGPPAVTTYRHRVFAFIRRSNGTFAYTSSARALDKVALVDNPPNAVFGPSVEQGAWAAWTNETRLTSSSAPSVVAMRNNLFVFARDTSNRIRVMPAHYDVREGLWDGLTLVRPDWQEFCASTQPNCGQTDVTPVGATLAKRLYAFGKGVGDSKIYIKSTEVTTAGVAYQPNYSNWDEVQHQTGTFTTSTALAATGYGDYLFVARVNSSGRIEWNAAKDGEAFNGWQQVPGTQTTVQAPTIAVLNDRIYFFAVDSSGRMFITSASFTRAGGQVSPFKATKGTSGLGEDPTLRDFFAVNTAVLRKGTNDTRVLLYGGHAQLGAFRSTSYYGETSWTWNPATSKFSGGQPFPDDSANGVHTDPFCGHMVALADGKLLAMGGEEAGNTGNPGNDVHAAIGAKGAFVFDPATETWSNKTPMRQPRWYPTPVIMANGEVFVSSGFGTGHSHSADNPDPIEYTERYSPSANTWTQNPTAHMVQTYPSLHYVPKSLHAGRIFYSGTRWGSDTAAYMPWNPGNPDGSWPPRTAVQSGFYGWGTGEFTPLATNPGNRTEGMSVLLPFSNASGPTIMVFGGGQLGPDANARSVASITLTVSAPVWTSTASMSMLYRRSNVNAVLLPDGKVALIGGQQCAKRDFNNCAVRQIELYNPTTLTSQRDAWLAKPRGYHSEAVLLPDGRVFVTGGEDVAQNDRDDQNNKSYEIYSPPYMFAANRPVINNWPSTQRYDAPLAVSVQTTRTISKLVLMRPTAVTHHTSSDQRQMLLSFPNGVPSNGSAFLTVTANHFTAANMPPGDYLLFVVNDQGTPSEGRWLRLAL
jgi:hypothetical protein